MRPDPASPVHRSMPRRIGVRCLRSVALATLAALLIAVAPAGYSAPLSLTDAPLFVTTPANPNVMLLIDNSGSMNNIIWASGYDNSQTYASYGGILSSATYCLPYTGSANVTLGGKTLRLPTPAPTTDGCGTRYYGNYINYLYNTYSNGTDLSTGTIPNDYRMNVAKTVATSLVNNTAGMRFGVSRFYEGQTSDSSLDDYYGHGAQIDAACGSSTSSITSAISGYTSSTNTPLAEAYYELTRYFRGLSSYYRSGTHTSPLQYRCQKNFIIVITDGFPTKDNTFPTDDPDDVANTSFALPNWDALAPTTLSGAYPNFPQYSDGFKPEGTSAQEGYSLYLDDLAKFGYDVDMKTTGTDTAGGSWQDPNFTKQNITTYTVGFAVANQMLQDAASYGGGIYYTATNATQLSSALSNAIADIGTKSASAAAVAVNSRSLNTNSRLYQALLTSGSWSGDLVAYPIDTSGNVGSTPVWRAKDKLIAQDWNTGRAILTRNATKGIPFRWGATGADALTSNTQTVLNKNPATGSTDSQGQARLEYLRGSNANEGTGNDYRVRSGNFKLGDIANSSPIYVGAPVYLPDLESVPHSSFRSDYVARQEMVYVGANDGMLHGFDAATTGGNEKIAYVPSFLFDDPSTPANPNTTNGPHQLTNKSYSHRYYVDAPPTAGDAYGAFTSGTCVSPGCWRTVLVSGVGRGGKGYFALDITDPTGAKTATAALAFNEGNAANIALWEFTDSASGDMGFTYGQATIARVKTGASTTAWAAIFGNGYNSTNERAVLYVVNIVTGAQIAKIVLPDPELDPNYPTGANPLIGNGLSTPAVVDKDGDYIQDYVYAGDLKGNLWKIDLTNNSPSSWGSFYKRGSKPVPLYTAKDGTNRLPITARPEVGAHPAGQDGYMVYFGTGRYLASGDNDPNATPVLAHAFHGVWDRNTTASASVSGQDAAVLSTRLLTQTISTATVASQTVRQVTNNALNNWGDTGTACNPTSAGNNCMGWIVSLPTTGERSVSNPVLLGGTTPRIIYTTLIPDNAACAFGGSSWLMEHNPINGGPPSAGVFDLDGSNTITSADLIGGTIPVAGINPGIGIMPEPVILRDPANSRDLKLITGSTGVVKSTANYPGTGSGGRQSWRQLK